MDYKEPLQIIVCSILVYSMNLLCEMVCVLDNYSFFIESRQSNWEIDMVAYARNHNHSTWEADAGRITRLKPLELHSEFEASLPQKHNNPKGHIDLPLV